MLTFDLSFDPWKMWNIRILKSPAVLSTISQWGAGNKYDKMATYFFATRKKLNIGLFCLFVCCWLRMFSCFIISQTGWVLLLVSKSLDSHGVIGNGTSRTSTAITTKTNNSSCWCWIGALWMFLETKTVVESWVLRCSKYTHKFLIAQKPLDF